MNRLVSIPREDLAALLKASGSPLTVEDYLASLQVTSGYEKYGSRSVAAAWSKYFLLGATILSGLFTCLPMGFDLESVLITLILAAFTFVEFRVHRAFRDCAPEAPSLGFRNQVAFAAFILIYCLYHAFAPMQVPANYREYMDPDMSRMVRTFTIAVYLTIGIVGGVSQLCLALYYWSARGRVS